MSPTAPNTTTAPPPPNHSGIFPHSAFILIGGSMRPQNSAHLKTYNWSKLTWSFSPPVPVGRGDISVDSDVLFCILWIFVQLVHLKNSATSPCCGHLYDNTLLYGVIFSHFFTCTWPEILWHEADLRPRPSMQSFSSVYLKTGGWILYYFQKKAPSHSLATTKDMRVTQVRHTCSTFKQ